MEPLPDLSTILDAIKLAQGVLADALPNIEDPELKRMVSMLTQDIESHRAELVQVYPDTVRQLTESEAALDATVARLTARSDEWQATLAAMEAEAAKAAAAAPVIKPKAPAKPATMRPAPPAAPPDDDSVWRGEMSTWDSGTQAAPAAPRPPTPRPRPDVWDPNESVRDIGESSDDDPSRSR